MTHWVTAWAMAHTDAASFALSLGGRTSQAELYCPIGGDQVRIKLSNRYGSVAIRISTASVWTGNRGCPLTFDGQTSVSVLPGQELRSDGAKFSIPAGSQVCIRLYFDEGQTAASGNALISGQHAIPGDYTGSAQFSVDSEDIWTHTQRLFPLTEPVMLLSALEVSNDNACAVAVLGDSNTFNGFYTKPLAELLGQRSIALLNLGISGNRLMHDSSAADLGRIFGQAAQTRIEWDVFDLCGLETVILAVGGNDIFQPGTFAAPIEQLCTIQQLWDATVQLSERCQAHKLDVIGSTLVPFGGADAVTAEKLDIRRQYNQLVRQSGQFQTILDFNEFLRDPAQPDRYLPSYDSGDHLHFNPAAGTHVAKCAVGLFK